MPRGGRKIDMVNHKHLFEKADKDKYDYYHSHGEMHNGLYGFRNNEMIEFLEEWSPDTAPAFRILAETKGKKSDICDEVIRVMGEYHKTGASSSVQASSAQESSDEVRRGDLPESLDEGPKDDQPRSNEFLDAEVKDSETMDNETMDNETMDNETMDNETMDNETMDNETMDNETMDNETMDNETMGNETNDNEGVPCEQAVTPSAASAPPHQDTVNPLDLYLDPFQPATSRLIRGEFTEKE